MPTTATWSKRHEFAIEFEGGERTVVASVPAEERPGPGPSPMDLVQAAVVSCTGIDVVMILEKMRKTLETLRIDVHATRREAPPRIFTRLELVYHVDGADLTEDAVRRAVRLSQEKYCSVAAMLQPAVQLDSRIVLNGQELD
jgi:putative redox protein